MGAEAMCTARFNRTTASGKAKLETDVLLFRGGELKLAIPFKEISRIEARVGELAVTWSGGRATLVLGTAAPKWAEKIRNPPSRLTKLGVKPGMRVSIVAFDDAQLVSDIEAAGATVIVGRAAKESDIIFFGASHARELMRLAPLTASLAQTGALWVLRPKGRPEISEGAVMAAGKAAGLVDVKVASYSSTHTAEKFVIPVARRKRG